MTYKMSDLKGIDENHVAKLRDVGVETTDDMMRVWNDQANRIEFVTKSTLSDDQFIKLASMARVARMKGVGPKYAGLLVTAGVRGRKSLSTFTPEALVKHLGDVSAAKGLAGPVPTLLQVGQWFAELKPAPPDSTAS